MVSRWLASPEAVVTPLVTKDLQDLKDNVWPAPSATVKLNGALVCINVSGLRGISPGQDGFRAFQAS
jgi:hypothetical protein